MVFDLSKMLLARAREVQFLEPGNTGAAANDGEKDGTLTISQTGRVF